LARELIGVIQLFSGNSLPFRIEEPQVNELTHGVLFFRHAHDLFRSQSGFVLQTLIRTSQKLLVAACELVIG
jgi:hypothetical protein